MAAKKRPRAKRIEDVRIPVGYIGRLERVFGAIQGRIVREAFAIALARKTGLKAGYVTLEDLAQSARRILPTASAQIEESLVTKEPAHARRQSA